MPSFSTPRFAWLLAALLTGLVRQLDAQPPAPTECCFDATCTFCYEVEDCENYFLGSPADAIFGGAFVCGSDSPLLQPCSSFSENNSIGGVCVASCNDPQACNFFDGSWDNSECVYPQECEDCAGQCLNDLNDNAICDCFEIFGCTDALACNYNEAADADDGSCTFADTGFNCDGSCIDNDGDGICLLDELHGCTDSLAINFYPFITEEDGSCIYEEDFANESSEDCPGDLNGDNYVSVSDILMLLSFFELTCD